MEYGYPQSSIKGVLKYSNIEFPKEHDIGEYFEEILMRRKIDYDSDSMRKIIFASKDLVSKRARYTIDLLQDRVLILNTTLLKSMK